MVLVMLLSLSACQTYLFGKYTNEDGSVEYTFQSNNFTLARDGLDFEGTYLIKKGEITFTFEDESQETFSYAREGTATIIGGEYFNRAE